MQTLTLRDVFKRSLKQRSEKKESTNPQTTSPSIIPPINNTNNPPSPSTNIPPSTIPPKTQSTNPPAMIPPKSDTNIPHSTIPPKTQSTNPPFTITQSTNPSATMPPIPSTSIPQEKNNNTPSKNNSSYQSEPISNEGSICGRTVMVIGEELSDLRTPLSPFVIIRKTDTILNIKESISTGIGNQFDDVTYDCCIPMVDDLYSNLTSSDISFTLTIEETIAIYFYTYEWPTPPNLYSTLNMDLTSIDRKTALPKWKSYLYYLFSGIRKLPNGSQIKISIEGLR